MADDPRSLTLEAFEARFGLPPEWLVRAPGRVNLLGEHVDYAEGWVLPGAIDRAVWLAARPAGRKSGAVEALDLGSTGDLDPARLPSPVAKRRDHASDWLDVPRGVAWALAELGLAPPALDVVFGSNLPIGAGLSSSAAVEVAFSLAWEAAMGKELSGVERARLGQRAENGYMGVESGIMDQYASIHGAAGHVLLLDCRTLEHREVKFPEGLGLLVADSGVRRRLGGSGYNDRPDECRQATMILKQQLPHITTLRDVMAKDLDEYGDALPPTLLCRARHVVGECRRVHVGASALETGDVAAFGDMMRASHESLRDLYEVSIPELDLLAETAWTLDGCHGARLTGAGFGGCVTAVVDEVAADYIAWELSEAFEARFGRTCTTYVMKVADGAGHEPI